MTNNLNRQPSDSDALDQSDDKDSILDTYLVGIGLAQWVPEIHSAIAQGAQDVLSIMTQPRSVDEIREASRKMRHSPASTIQVTGIMWYLTYLSIERGQTFVTGAYLCRDPEGRLAAYFNGIGTPRISSHLKRHTSPGCTAGIDLRIPAGKSNIAERPPPLPHGHCHILSIAIVNDKRRGKCLYLKPERYGVHGIRNLAHHAIMYSKSLKRKHTFGGNEVPGMRKERIPDDFVVAFAEAAASLEGGSDAIAEVGRRGKGEGIGGMYEFLTRTLGDASVVLPEGSEKRMRHLLGRLESEYDFVDLRFGNEVVIDLPVEINRTLPEAPGVVGPSPLLRWASSAA
ncbi:predicted protein [Chaetomium globosum CBS 148.51]|uniref:Uncharacterized protein n=1 Tax=Chaetomium globosum (strain ATCC 6205 / CBS 148.51 / DSM 1962 / NBRC 6347 / NRRL 1970) TaxID=306901 RepID=Q2H2F1_CHAGB|nr:uncharacterized protein CHGG_04045 [Chaetomium globosum CBS 148.51]EAQ87426.1 predicted protein [Chaetomium globosum CBS 148.51]